MKVLYIIAGCNGAGKTTASQTMLPEIWNCREFVNVDEIARGLSPFNSESMSIEAGRIMLKRIKELLKGDESFAIETTLSTRSYVRTIEEAHKNGFTVQLLFFWLPTPETAIERVRQRVAEGGHNIPTNIIRRRYTAGIKNLFNLYMSIVDSWLLVENLNNPRVIIASGGNLSETKILNIQIYNKVESYVR
ncbi:MAG: zeta toxin family protein [Prevotellaceae bacterium]|nr:zeta toxin family protein [Candidatus Colivivens caballi]